MSAAISGMLVAGCDSAFGPDQPSYSALPSGSDIISDGAHGGTPKGFRRALAAWAHADPEFQAQRAATERRLSALVW